jgi:hypothetical protein
VDGPEFDPLELPDPLDVPEPPELPEPELPAPELPPSSGSSGGSELSGTDEPFPLSDVSGDVSGDVLTVTVGGDELFDAGVVVTVDETVEVVFVDVSDVSDGSGTDTSTAGTGFCQTERAVGAPRLGNSVSRTA